MNDLTMARRHAGAFKAVVASAHCVVATSACAGLLGAQAVSAETFQYYEVAVGGVRYGESPGSFGTGSNGGSGVAEAIGGTDWSTSASSNDLGGGRVSSHTVIASPATADPSFIQSLTAVSRLTYAFSLEGPATTTRIPVLLTGAGGISANLDYGYASAFLGFSSAVDEINASYSLNSVALNMTPEDTDHAFAVNDIFYITPGSQLSMSLDAYAYVSYPGIANGKVAASSAFVDPTFTILGGFANSYQFVGLPESAINQSPVPEPASWLLLLAGWGALGAMAGRRNSKRASEAT